MINIETGDIITFYSYKGGTGRTMALSNIACLLAEKYSGDRGVLMIDWDLEAPGLHRFFHDRFKNAFANESDPIGAFDEIPGLIDLFIKLDANIPDHKGWTEESEAFSKKVLDSIRLDDFIIRTDIPNLYILKAGQFNEAYSTKVNTFNWESLYNRSPSLIRFFAQKLAERYSYVLIDSRTGYTDISGICTMLMPQKLVMVFTPSRQSYTGIKELVRRATKYRSQSDDLRPLLVYPLPSRIEFSRDDLRADWRSGNKEKGITGYQPMFEDLFREVYGLRECSLIDYFEDVQIQQSPNYAYGEEIAVKIEQTVDRFSITRSYKTFTEWLANSVPPWQLSAEKINALNITASKLFEEGKYDKAMNTWREVLGIDARNQNAVEGLEKINRIRSKEINAIEAKEPPRQMLETAFHLKPAIILLSLLFILSFGFLFFSTNSPIISTNSPQLYISKYPFVFQFDILKKDDISQQVKKEEILQMEFNISNDGGGTLDWIIGYNQPWIKLKPENGTGSSRVVMSVDPKGMLSGNYAGNIIVNSNGGSKSGKVYLNILQIPVLSINPDNISFDLGDMREGESTILNLQVSNAGAGDLIYEIIDYPPYLTANINSGTGSGNITLNLNTTSLDPGAHTKPFTVISNGGVMSGEVFLNVVPGNAANK